MARRTPRPPAGVRTDADTKSRILDEAEKLFAEQGFHAASLRQITDRAKSNLAAVNYHFGSKRKLMVAVLLRRVRPLNQARLALLDELERDAGADPVPPGKIIEAMIRPLFLMSQDRDRGGDIFVRLLGRVFMEPGELIHEVFTEFEPLVRRFEAALRRSFPGLPRDVFFWRMHFFSGAVLHTITQHHRLDVLSRGLCRTMDVEATIRHLVTFAVAGMKSPLPPDENSAGSAAVRHRAR